MGIGGFGVSGQGLDGIANHTGISDGAGLISTEKVLSYDFANDQNIDGITYSGGANGTYFDSSGTLQVSGADEARFTHDPATGAPLGLLIEEQRINVGLQSEDFSTTWGILGLNAFGAGSVVNSTATPDPYGTNVAEFIQEDTGTSNHWTRQQSIAADPQAAVTATVFVKAAGRDFCEIQLTEHAVPANGLLARFDLTNGDVVNTGGTGTGLVASSEAIGNGWYRLRLSGIPSATGTLSQVYIYLAQTDVSANAYTGDGSSGIYVFGAQVEESSFPTSYIKTTTVAVTRTADVATIALSSIPGFNQSAGTFVVEGIINAPVGAANNYIFQVDDGGSSDRLRLFNPASGAMQFDTITSVGNGGSSAKTTVTAGVAFKAAGAYSQDDVIVALDGALGTADTTADLPTATALVTLRIGSFHTTGGFMNGTVASLTIYNTRKPNEFLQAITA